MGLITSKPPYGQKGGTGCCLLVVAVLLAGLIGFSWIRFNLDRQNYTKANLAYRQGDCAGAIPSYDLVLEARRLIDIQSLAYFSNIEKNECLLYEQARQELDAGKPSQALVLLVELVSYNLETQLLELVQAQTADLLDSPGPPSLVSLALCEHVTGAAFRLTLPDAGTDLPYFLTTCGRAMLGAGEDLKAALAVQRAMLIEFPDHPLAAEAALSMIENPATCDEIDSLETDPALLGREDDIPGVMLSCGLRLEGQGDFEGAIRLFEKVLENYPEHVIIPEVKQALARASVAQAREAGAGELPSPQRSGSADANTTVVTIQNDSPEDLRIIFSGPQGRIEELEACDSCTRYFGTGPLFCPEKGPIGSYILLPGQYDVLVEAISSTGVTPFVGSWNLRDGSRFYSCFFIVQTFK